MLLYFQVILTKIQQLFMLKIITFLGLIIIFANSQQCLNHEGNAVDWMVLLHAPGTVSEGYLYFDSLSTQSRFKKFSQRPDATGHPINRTLSQINEMTNLDWVAWNDQNPNGSTTSVKAHSKNVLVFDKTTKDGIVIVHSMPKYPAFIQGKVDVEIPDSQRVYGQHFFCFRAPGAVMNQIFTKASSTRLNIYESTFTIPQPYEPQDFFLYSNYTVGNSKMRTIYKNGRKNSSIFEDGLTNMFYSNILAETWGRPAQLPWCGNETIPYETGNIEYLSWDVDHSWKRTQDHAKWAIPVRDGVDFSCFGDMNRMESQFKRGGMFFCVESQKLKAAMFDLILIKQVCVDWK